jgi:hypothetical protein
MVAARGRVCSPLTGHRHRRPACPAPTSFGAVGGGYRMTNKRRAASAAVFLPPTGDKLLDARRAPRRAAAIARILKAVGKSRVNKKRLAADIVGASMEKPSYLDVLEGSSAKSRLKKVRRILQALAKQDALIDADPYIGATINKIDWPFQVPPIKDVLLRLLRLERSLAWLSKQWRGKVDVPDNLKDRRPTEREWLAGVSLPLVYERHFLRRAGRSRNVKGDPTGPMVDFIDAALKELGLPYARESIVRAFTRLSAQRTVQRDAGGLELGLRAKIQKKN